MQKRRKCIILGAGPAGLVAGWKLAEQGWSVQLFEKENIVGGMCRTWKWGEFLLDTGPHLFHTPDQLLAQFWQKEFGDILLQGDFWCKNVQGEAFNEYWDYPLSWESISRFEPELKRQILSELKKISPEKKARAKNFSEFMEAQVGPTLRKMFFEKYPQKIWGIPTDDLTPNWAPKKIEFRQKVTPFYYGQWNAVGKFGTGCVFDRIADKIKKHGGEICLDKDISGLETENHSIRAICFKDGSTVSIDEDDIVISTLPVTLLSKFLNHESDLKFRGIKSVYLGYKKPQILPQGIHWLYYDSDKVLFNRVTEAKKLSPFVAPAGKSYLTAEITFANQDDVDRIPKEELIKCVSQQIEEVGLASVKDLIDGEVSSECFVYPLQFKGYQEELSKVKSLIAQYQQLYSLGTGGDFSYTDIQIIFHKAFDLVNVLCGKDSAFTQVIRQTPRCKMNSTVEINGRQIGDGYPAYVIAEIGLNHNGDMKMARELIDAAVDTGCDAVKFQTFEAASRVSRKVKAVKYAETIIGLEETIYDMFDRLAMSQEEQKEIFSYAKEKGLEIFSTPFDFENVDFLNSVGVSVFKIASMDLVNIPLIKHVARLGKPIILSCGMSTLGQVEEAVDAVCQAGNPNLMLLHCNSSYPAAEDEMNLRVIQTLKECFKIPVGLSDHTFGLFVSQTALAVGANLIERHFTLDRTLEGPDHILSSEPDEFRNLVSTAERLPKLLGDGIKRIEPNEYANLNMQRKSLHAACPIRKGEMISKEKVAIKGPGGGLLPKYYDLVIGRVAKEDIEEDFPITWDVI